VSLHPRGALTLSSHPQAFDPGQIAAVAAGYWWDPAAVRGSGASIVLPEMNGRSAYDMVTPSANTAPTATTINGRPVLTYTNGADDSLLRTAAKQTRGWTGATYVWGWINSPSAPDNVLGHYRTAHNIVISLNSSRITIIVHDASSDQEAHFPLPPGGYAAGPFFYELLAKPGSAISFAVDRVAQTPSLSATVATSVQDSSEYITVGGTVGDAGSSNYSASFSAGAFGIAQGEPTTLERDALFAFRALK
jgi:hypothetical protein